MSKETMLAWVTGAGAMVALVANPVFGAFSDRTASRFGRRRPWTLAGALLGALSLLLLGQARGLWTMIIAWCLVQLTLNAAFAAVTAAVPDRVPRLQRGTVGGWLGAAQILGVVAGTGLATVTGGVAAGYAACAACSACCRTCATRRRRCRPRRAPRGRRAASWPVSSSTRDATRTWRGPG
jgi:MFS family permease